jgi:hypothetical protein
VEGARYWRCPVTEAQGERQDSSSHATGQDPEGLRQPLRYDMSEGSGVCLGYTKLCTVVPDMKLSPNVGSDRSWVWNAAADVSEGEPEAQTLAIRFANSESKFAYV